MKTVGLIAVHSKITWQQENPGSTTFPLSSPSQESSGGGVSRAASPLWLLPGGHPALSVRLHLDQGCEAACCHQRAPGSFVQLILPTQGGLQLLSV